MDPSAFPTVATVIGFTPESDSGPLVATLACPITTEEVEMPVAGHESPSANIVETIHKGTNDPVTKALVDNIVGNLPTKKPVVKLRCDICNIEVTGKAVLEMHLAGAKHFKKMKLIESLTRSQEQAEVCKPTPPNPLLCFKCEVCNISVNSIQQLQVHSQGTKHKNNVANLSQKQNKLLEQEPLCCPPAHPGFAVTKFPCSKCNIVVNSAYQLEQHEASRKHKESISNNMSTSKNNRFQSYSRTEPTQPDNPPTSRNSVQKMNSNVSSSNRNNRFEPYSRESTFDRATPVLGLNGAADAQFSCSVCKIKLNSAIQLQQHEASKKHAEKVSGYACPSDAIEQIKTPNGANSNAGVKSFKCVACNVHTNSMVQLRQHYESWKHIVKVGGTPAFKDRPTSNTPPQTYLTKNFFKRPMSKRSMSDGYAGSNKFNNSTMQTRSYFVSSQQLVMNRVLNNFKSNSDYHPNTFNRLYQN